MKSRDETASAERTALHGGDTIVALSTPRGRSGIGVIRMSGPDSLPILKRLFRPVGDPAAFPVRRAVYGRVFDPRDGRSLDDGIALYFKGPHSYTGEDMVELSLHGSPVVLDMVVRCAVEQGARPATGGEFTRRAFLAGKLDLVQVEGVMDLIDATSPAAVAEARSLLDRKLSRRIGTLSSALKDLLAEVEAHIDFDEDDLESAPEPLPALEDIVVEMRRLIEESQAGRIRREGLKTVIAGRPNAGKSTLFNALLGTDRTIVTPFAGTTRDTVEETLVLDGLAFVLVDTAGIRSSPEPVEEEGIRRTRLQIDAADLVLAVFDGSLPLNEDDRLVVDACKGKHVIMVISKLDIARPSAELAIPDLPTVPRLEISARTGQGMKRLVEVLRREGKRVAGETSPGSAGTLTPRALLLMEAAVQPLETLLKPAGIGRAPEPEIVAMEIRAALARLGEITGESVDEGVLERIFERFCVGK